VESGSGPGEPGKPTGHKPSFETRIALIGVVGALAGTLVGGLVTWVVTQDQLSSQRADARRAERLDAYANYFGDAARLWTQEFSIVETRPRPRSLNGSQKADLTTLEETLTREYALVALAAPKSVRTVARELNNADTDLGNALLGERIDYRLYEQAKGKDAGGPSNFLLQFEGASQKDLGTAERSERARGVR
jgi:hypothetical protein